MMKPSLICSLVTTFLLYIDHRQGAQGQPIFQTVPQDLDDVKDGSSVVVNGSVVLLFCSATGATAPPSISWTRNGADPESPPLIHITTTVTSLTNLTSSLLTIREFSLATAGLYACKAALQGTTIQSNITLTAAYNDTLNVTRELNDSDIFDGDQSDWRTFVTLGSATPEYLLSCSAQYVGPTMGAYPDVTWYKDGRQLNNSDDVNITTVQYDSSSRETISSVSISNFTQSDAGIYQCVFFTSTEVLASIPLRLDTGPVSLTAVSPPLVYLSPPAPVVAEVYAQGKYSSILWSACPSNSLQYIINFGQTLVRTAPSTSDYGPYSASLVGNDSNVTVIVTPFVPANITNISPGGVVLEGSNFSVSCIAVGSPPPVISWTQNGQPTQYPIISNSTSPSVTNCSTTTPGSTTSILQITSILYSGTYTCNATNTNGSSVQSVNIELQVPPNITSPVADFTYTVNASDPVTFQCTASGIPPPLITFSKGYGPLSSAVDPRVSISAPITGSIEIGQQTVSTVFTNLTINSTVDGDSGNYTCVASNQGAAMLYSNQTFQLVVQLLPTITTPPVTQALVLQSYPISLTCDASGVPTPDISWWRTWSNGSSVQVFAGSIITSSVARNTSSNLTIQSAQPSDAGNYTCTATNVVGSVSTIFNVSVQVPPNITSPVADFIYTVNASDPVTFECTASGIPPPLITFYYSYGPLNSAVDPRVSISAPITGSIVIGQQTVSTVSRSLTINSTVDGDSGNYTCVASNQGVAMLYSNQTFQLVVQILPTITTPPVTQTVVLQNYSFSLTCNASGVPTPDITWWRTWSNGSSVQVFGGQYISIITSSVARNTSSNLTIQSAQPSDAGNYTCTATNVVGSVTATANVFVQVIPQITFPPSPYNYVANKTSNVTFVCTATGIPPPMIQWYPSIGPGRTVADQGSPTPFSTPGGYVWQVNATLTVINVQQGDTGVYACWASNGVGPNITQNFTLFVQVPPVVVAVNRSLVVIEGQNGTISFLVEQAIPPVQPWNLQWLYSSFLNSTSPNGDSITNVTNRTITSSFSFSAFVNSTSISLTITNVQLAGATGGPTDDGRYFLVATNPAGSSSDYVDLVVEGIPRIITPPINQFVINGNTSMFMCVSYAYPQPNISWVFMDMSGATTSLTTTSKYNVTIATNGVVVSSTLTINDVQYQDLGQYICTASNIVGYVSSGATLTVQVKPVVISISNSSEVNISEPFSLQCIASGYPTPTIYWMKNGASVSSINIPSTGPTDGPPQVGSALNFTSVQRNDTANYTCVAVNTNITTLTASQTSQLVILELPDPPINIAISQYGSRWVLLTWMAGFNGNKPILSFNIYGQNLNISSSLQLVNNQTSINLYQYNSSTGQYLYNITTGIAPFTNYSFTTQACNLLGCGQNGSLALVFTLQDRPETPPSNCSISVNTSTSIGLQWQLPVVPNGIITFYNITYTPLQSRSGVNLTTGAFALSCANTPVNQNGYVNISALSSSLTPLLKATSYMIEIIAFTTVGGGPACQVNASTSDDVPEAAPGGLAVFSPTSTSIQVSWGVVPPVCRNGIILQYNVNYSTVSTNGLSSFATIVSSSSNSIVLTNLQIFVNYSVCVQARTSVDTFGPCSTPVLVRTLNDTSSAPQGVGTADIRTNQITVQWSPPTNPNGIISMYKVYYNSSVANLTNSTMATNLTLYNLRPGTPYDIGVSVINGAGEGTMSAPQKVTTQTDSNNNNAVAGRDAGIAVGLVIVALLLITVLVGMIGGYIWLRQRTFKRTLNTEPHILTNSYTLFSPERESLLTAEPFAATPEPIKRPPTTSPPPKVTVGNPIPVEVFSEYVQEKHVNENWAFYDDYKMIVIHGEAQSHSVDICCAAENTRKNRYNNVLAYDNSRVILNSIPGFPNDYINANYIPGYSSKKEYIATQGPLPDTLGDFWRMVWDNNVTTIVMLTNLQENSKVKCTQYWPSSGSQVYSNVTVTHVDTSSFANFELRHFNIQANGSRDFRFVAQFHFVSWPDFGVPRTPISLLHFLQRVRQHQPYGQTQPIVVHCSAGVGRTGTYLTIDVELQRARRERVVNPFTYIKTMRGCRNLMVQTEDQYVFLHDAILEALTYGDTVIPAEGLDDKVARLEKGKMTEYQTEFDTMKSPRLGPQLFTTATNPENQTKNLFSYALPYDYNLVQLNKGTHYINASFVDGYYKKAYYIAAQGPLLSTVGDFWQMIWDHNIQVVVMLNQLTEDDDILCPQYWPAALQKPEVYDSVTVELLSEKTLENYNVRKLKITVQTSEVSNSLVVHHYHYQAWSDSKSPESAAGVVELCEQVMKVQRQSGDKPIVIHCSDGVGRTGALCAVMVAIDRLKIEGVVDLQHTIRLLRTQRPNMVRTPDQYRFVYRAVKEYVNSLSDYSNFK